MRSRLCAATVATAIVLLSSSWAVAGQASESTVRVGRLVSLAEVWAAVKYFHPYLGYRDDIDWDAATSGYRHPPGSAGIDHGRSLIGATIRTRGLDRGKRGWVD